MNCCSVLYCTSLRSRVASPQIKVLQYYVHILGCPGIVPPEVAVPNVCHKYIYTLKLNSPLIHPVSSEEAEKLSVHVRTRVCVCVCE